MPYGRCSGGSNLWPSASVQVMLHRMDAVSDHSCAELACFNKLYIKDLSQWVVPYVLVVFEGLSFCLFLPKAEFPSDIDVRTCDASLCNCFSFEAKLGKCQGGTKQGVSVLGSR